MKKIFLCLLSLLLLVGCSSNITEDETEESTNMVNPVVEVDSLEIINDTLGCYMTAPGVMGSEDISYSIINDKIGQYVFSVNGYEYTYRFENDTTDDISGIYDNGDVIFKTKENTYYQGQGYKVYRWFNIDGQYCLAVQDNDELEKDQFIGIVEEFEAQTNENLVNGNS